MSSYLLDTTLGHRDLRMTRRYAQVASIQIETAVNGLDSMLGAAQEGEKALVSHLLVTGTPALPEAEPVTQ